MLNLVLTLENCIEPPSYARTAYVVVMWRSFLFDSFVKIWATWKTFLGKWFTAPLAKKFPYAYDKTDGYVYLFGEQDSKKVLSIPPGQVDFLAGIFFQTHLPNAQDSGRSPYKWIINYRKAGNGPRKAKCESCLNVATHVRTWSWKRFERKV